MTQPIQWTRRAIMEAASCPQCGAQAGYPCSYKGKGSTKKMRIGSNHHGRVWRAQHARPDTAPSDDLIDDEDDF